jgi:hypothetical protein
MALSLWHLCPSLLSSAPASQSSCLPGQLWSLPSHLERSQHRERTGWSLQGGGTPHTHPPTETERPISPVILLMVLIVPDCCKLTVTQPQNSWQQDTKRHNTVRCGGLCTAGRGLLQPARADPFSASSPEPCGGAASWGPGVTGHPSRLHLRPTAAGVWSLVYCQPAEGWAVCGAQRDEEVYP